jgi:hypothetical protein
MNRRPIKTPVGTAVWPKLNEPDTRWKAEGEYSVTLRLSAEDSAKIIQELEGYADVAYKSFCQQQGKNKLKRAGLPVQPVTDEAGEETGEHDFKFKLKARVETRRGDVFTQQVRLFDSKGTPMNEDVGGGSRIRVAGEINPWYTASLGFGLSLWVRAVQVIDLVEPKSGGSATSFGFSEVDGSFTTSGEQLGDEEVQVPVDDSADF